MPKPHEDLLKKYWSLIAQLEWDYDIEDFANEETLRTAIKVLEDQLAKAPTKTQPT